MNFTDPKNLQCDECGAIFRELRDAWRAARARFRAAWESSGRDHSDFRRALPELLSRASETDGLQPELLQQHAPDVAAAQRRMAQHESATGHSVLKDGWRSAGLRNLSDFI
jgi:hypothetical protein